MDTPTWPSCEPESTHTNKRGNAVKSWGCGAARAFCGGERYYWDFGPCGPGTTWKQYDTDQDAWYFGVWVEPERRLVLTYAEGDLSLVECGTAESFKAELANMAEFYGDPPPAFTVIDQDGTVTQHYDTRPT